MRADRSTLARRVALAALFLTGCGIITVDPNPTPAAGKSDDPDPGSVRRAGRGPGVCAMALHRAMAAMPTAADTNPSDYSMKMAEYSMLMSQYHICLASDSASSG